MLVVIDFNVNIVKLNIYFVKVENIVYHKLHIQIVN